MNFPAHPDDVWVEVTGYFDAVPQMLLAVSGAEAELAFAREKYAIGHLTLEQFESEVDRVYEGAA